MLWIALHLPQLSLESFGATLAHEPGESVHTSPQPVALVDAHHIACVNPAASALGVKPGLKRGTALALAPDIVLGQADAARDAQAILGVAHAALAFTPSVTFEPPEDPQAAPHTVLLEVQASLRYFGGLNRLLKRLHAALQPLQHTVHCASAPTPKGAALLARMPDPGDGRHADGLSMLNRMLDAVPVWLLGPGREHWEALQGMGLRVLSDLRSLPRSGLARRFSEALLDDIDRARGIQPDPRDWVTLSESFDSRLELFARADTTEQVLHGASILLARLVSWASAQHSQVSRFTLHMQHEPRHRHDARTPEDSTMQIALAEPSRDIGHMQVLLRERLAHLQLVAPTLELRLHCNEVLRRAPPNTELFPTAKSEREGLTRLIERLQARLGVGQVQRLRPVEDHRPERATDALAAQASAMKNSPDSPPALQGPQRPVWLLPTPEPLPERQLRPLLDGKPLQLVCGPERIEAGWWDNALAERDYFIALAGDGALVWIYRARLPMSVSEEAQGWFLQGRFG
ncbi:Y-family DNA polymerase [Piscinibacter terrae]|uniref:DNA polymerase Y family protein n=1 Tax=Piscinibacter terrae TaxID=2496871 RepID=A0A3N7HRI6_9BURK|nr:DNA polymerase Y family protein [Albitalea terrae]RQP24860.1 DNA polymerase Y family protein [Albitalea terrae]